MTQTLPKVVTYEEFIAWLPNDGKRHELHDGVIVEMLWHYSFYRVGAFAFCFSGFAHLRASLCLTLLE